MANDLWRTPPEVMDFLKFEFKFTPDVDACASAENTKCNMFYSEENSFLEVKKDDLYRSKIWCNPPYSNPMPFIRQCSAIAESGDNEVFMLLNMDTSTKWFRYINECPHAAIMPIIGGRIGFIDGENNQKAGNNKPQVLIRFKKEYGYMKSKATWQEVDVMDINFYK